MTSSGLAPKEALNPAARVLKSCRSRACSSGATAPRVISNPFGGRGSMTNRKIERIWDHLNSSPPFAEFYGAGYTPDDARAAAELLLRPYVSNREWFKQIPM